MRRAPVSLAGCALVALAAGCDYAVPPELPPGPGTLDAQLRQAIGGWGIVPIGPVPAQDSALVALGRALMFDPILSGNRDIACATCHHPSQSMADGLSLAVGTGGSGIGPARTLGAGRQFGPRSAPTLLNVGLGLYQVFWEGRVSGFGQGPFTSPEFTFPTGFQSILAAQAVLPIVSRQEMRGNPGDLDVFGNPNDLAQLADTDVWGVWGAVMQRLRGIPGYVAMFEAAFPGTPLASIGVQQAAAAIAAFQVQALTRTDSPFDRYLARDDAALSIEAKQGGLLFFGRAQCSSCHNGPMLGSQSFANVGAPQLGPGTGPLAPLDLGRANLDNQQFYQFAFRVAPLRNVELTAPYFHDGAYPTLEAVVNHYDDVGTALRGYDASQLAPAVRASYHGEPTTLDTVLATLDFRLRQPLDLTDAEKAQIVAFLKSLTDPAARDLSGLRPASVPSGLPVP